MCASVRSALLKQTLLLRVVKTLVRDWFLVCCIYAYVYTYIHRADEKKKDMETFGSTSAGIRRWGGGGRGGRGRGGGGGRGVRGGAGRGGGRGGL